jgi:glycosyltransferase involved in cell wall biosynthesis
VRILVLSFYFEPDLCAGSFRNTALVRVLSGALAADDTIDVITTIPHRYNSFSAPAERYETIGNTCIHRIALPTHKSGVVGQALAFMSYVRGVLSATKNQSYDLVYASSSRLMTAALGAIVARRQSTLLYLDIRDIFTETVSDLYHRSPVCLLLPVLKRLERFSIQSAARINLVSPDFIDHFIKIDKSQTYRMFTNGVDQLCDDGLSGGKLHHSEYKEILYAGNIGEGQGLHRIIPKVATLLGPEWRIRIIGDGGKYQLLEESIKGLENVVINSPIARGELLKYYRNAEVLFLHLNDHPAFLKVLPSKIFDYAATGKPIIAGVAGYAEKFLNDNVKNSAVFSPCDPEGFSKALNTLNFKITPRIEFLKQFDRTRIMKEMAGDILSLVSADHETDKEMRDKLV